MKPRIGLIVLNWNSSSDTIACMYSLSSMENIDKVKIYIVDNASEQKDFLKLRDFVSQGHDMLMIELIRNDSNIGFGAGNNVALREAIKEDFEYVWLLNNDTLVEKDTLEGMLSVADSDKSIGIVGCKLVYAEGREKIQALGGGLVSTRLGISRHIIEYDELKKINYITAASCLIRMDALKDVGIFREDIFLYWEDVDISLRMQRRGWKIAVAVDSIVYHKESASTKKLGVKRQLYFTQGLDLILRDYAGYGRLGRFILHSIRSLRKLVTGRMDEAKVIMKYAILNREKRQ